MAEVAFPADDVIKGHSKIGALLSLLVGLFCWGIAQFHNFKEEDVVDQAHQQVEEEVMDQSRNTKGRNASDNSLNHSRSNSREGSRSNSRSNSREGSPSPGLDIDGVELVARPTKLVKRDEDKRVEADLTGNVAVSPNDSTANGATGDEQANATTEGGESGGLKRTDSWFG